MTQKQCIDFHLVDKTDRESLVVMTLQAQQALPEVLPGQFVQVRINGSEHTYLRRPISIHDVDYTDNTLKLLVQKVGDGTKTLTSEPLHSIINVILPLGNTYTMPLAGEKVIMVGGGCGLAPYLLMGKMMKASGVEPVFLVGARNASLIPDLNPYRQLGAVHVITDDGSMGEKGLVTQHSIWNGTHFDRIYACGTRPMMKAVAALSRQQGALCEVSLENMMACGLGACLCCVEKTVDGNVCTCKEGPVFNINKLLW